MKASYSLLALLLVVACTKSKPADDTLILCTNSTYPPYESIDNEGKAVGFDIDLANSIAKELGKKLKIQEMAFDSLILGLQQKKCDFTMAGMSITPSKQKEITMIPYQGDEIRAYNLIFWDKAPESIDSIEEIKKFKNGTIAVQIATRMEDYLRDFPDLKYKPLDSTSDLILEIQYGKSATALVEPHIGKELLAKNKRLKMLNLPLPESHWDLGNGIGIKKTNTDLKEKVEKALSSIKSSGELVKLEKKWFSAK